ncbi:RNA methyltransferase PUA domain-containing protein, partial [Duncaniella freteri]
MIQFYAPDIASTLTLPESDSRHAVKVLRMTEGDTLQAIDGCGLLYTC